MNSGSNKNQKKHTSPVLKGFVLPGLPHPLLAPEKNKGWARVKEGYEKVRQEIEKLKPDVILIYSTYWASVIGHQIQADPNPEWTLVDDQFHYLGSIPYKLSIDSEFSKEYSRAAKSKGLHTRTVAYKGFPIDTGSVVALKLINPKNKFKASIVSSNVYSDRAETLVLGKAAREALEKSNKKAVVITITSLSNRLSSANLNPKDDRIHSLKDEEWNQKILEFLKEGRLEDVSQLSRQVHKEARVSKVNNYKPFWWMAAVMGQNNLYQGEIYAYEPIHGTGAAVVGLKPSKQAARDLEFDENDPEYYTGDRNVLGGEVKF